MKTIPLRLRRILSGAALVACAALVLWAVHQPQIVGAAVSSRQLPIYRVQCEVWRCQGRAVRQQEGPVGRQALGEQPCTFTQVHSRGIAVSRPPFQA